MRHITPDTTRSPEVTDELGTPRRRAFGFTGTRGVVVGVIALTAVLVAGGLAAAHVLGTGHSATHATALNSAAAGPQGSSQAAAAGGMPQLAGTPQMAVMPKPAPRVAHKPTAAPSGSHSGSRASQSASAPSGGSATAPPSSSGSAVCAKPQFVTSDPQGMWNQDPYFVFNNMWGVNGYNVSQTLYACSYSNWYVVATMDNSKGDGAVKTYPNSHRDFQNEPQIASFKSITSTFAETSPHTGIYEDAYDIWINGIAGSNSTEVMIWNDNQHQVPSGSPQGTATFDGRSYTAWKADGYVAFVANSNFSSGTVNLLAFLQWIMSKGWMPSNSTLGQVDYGVELVSTNGVPQTFSFSNFTVSAS